MKDTVRFLVCFDNIMSVVVCCSLCNFVSRWAVYQTNGAGSGHEGTGTD